MGCIAVKRGVVTLGVATGMSGAAIAGALGISRRSLYQHFSAEMTDGRARLRLENIARLDNQAAAGNVSATKALMAMIIEADRATSADVAQTDGRWSSLLEGYGVVADKNFAQRVDFENAN